MDMLSAALISLLFSQNIFTEVELDSCYRPGLDMSVMRAHKEDGRCRLEFAEVLRGDPVPDIWMEVSEFVVPCTHDGYVIVAGGGDGMRDVCVHEVELRESGAWGGYWYDYYSTFREIAGTGRGVLLTKVHGGGPGERDAALDVYYKFILRLDGGFKAELGRLLLGVYRCNTCGAEEANAMRGAMVSLVAWARAEQKQGRAVPWYDEGMRAVFWVLQHEPENPAFPGARRGACGLLRDMLRTDWDKVCHPNGRPHDGVVEEAAKRLGVRLERAHAPLPQ